MNICDNILFSGFYRNDPLADRLGRLSKNFYGFLHAICTSSMNYSQALFPGRVSKEGYQTAIAGTSARLFAKSSMKVFRVWQRASKTGANLCHKIGPQISRLSGDLCACVRFTGGKQAHSSSIFRLQIRKPISIDRNGRTSSATPAMRDCPDDANHT
jgi:hypothetical protein